MTLCLTTLIVTSLAAGVRLELLPEARVRGTELSLGSIARVDGDDAARVESLRQLALGYAPAPGYSRRVHRWQLAQEIERAFPGGEIAIGGAEVCRVWPEVETISADAILAAAREALLAGLPRGDADVEPASPARSVDIPAGAEGFALRARAPGADAQSDARSVPVEILVDGELYQTVWTSWRVETWGEAAVLARAVRAGETLDAGDFRRERVRIDPTRSHLSEALAAGAVAARDLAAGAPVLERDVRRPRLVRAGDTVQLQVRKGAITATCVAIARQDGVLGERIRVATASSKLELQAVVQSRDLVAVELGPKP